MKWPAWKKSNNSRLRVAESGEVYRTKLLALTRGRINDLQSERVRGARSNLGAWHYHHVHTTALCVQGV